MPQPSIDLSPIHAFDEATMARTSGAQLSAIRRAAPRFQDWFRNTGTPDLVRTFDLVSVPYPTRFGLFRAAISPIPFVTMTNRLMVIRWRSEDGQRRTLLWEPSDVALGRNVPFYADLARRSPAFLERLSYQPRGGLLEHLASLHIAPDEVDYLSFDHLHIQDVRRLIGTRGPAEDLSPNGAVPAMFPRARLIVQQKELDLLVSMHPMQRPWYQPETYLDLRTDAILPIDGDVLLGPGVALLATPGHTPGNHSLVLHTQTGIWASSENAIATECLTPEHSRIHGLRRFAAHSGQEVVLNGNTIETTAEQYNSIMKEKLIVDPSRDDPRFLQFFPSAELTASWLSPGVNPTFVHRAVTHGALPAQASARGSARVAA